MNTDRDIIERILIRCRTPWVLGPDEIIIPAPPDEPNRDMTRIQFDKAGELVGSSFPQDVERKHFALDMRTRG